MRKLLVFALLLTAVGAGRPAAAQAGISLGAAVGGRWQDGKLSGDELHGLVYLRLGVPLVPYGARGDLLIFEGAESDREIALIGSAVLSLNAPLIQPYAIVGIGKYGFGDISTTGVSFGAGVRVGGRRGLFLENRRHDAINKTLVSLGVSF